ncbi:hypothetical protein [Synechococcus sp. CS-1332]|uniref:hypothetical protein n=1 Tax=Synechococcus sp. CS-1332 TaxID=2847972 RepID=UPI00223C2A85|nr:hypothetical protein [Synechococcus sp. CS-1332]MCT0206138.1 hypothetical protein [Synechococcus sp. CS-1332]
MGKLWPWREVDRVDGCQLSSSDLKRRGIAAIEEALQRSPVQLMKRNRTAAVVLSERQYQQLCQRAALAPPPEVSALEWLLRYPVAAEGRTKEEIDAALEEERDW